MRKPFYLSRRGAIWYVQFRDPKSGEVGTAKSTGLKNKTAATAWATNQAAENVEMARRPDLLLRDWASRFFMAGCPHITRIVDEGKPYAARTLTGNRFVLDRYILTDPIADMKLADIRRSDVVEFRSRLVTQVGRRRISQVAYSALRVILREAEFNEMIDRSPCSGIGQISYKQKVREAYSLVQISRILDPALYTDPLHWRAAYCAATTGLRQGEVRALVWGLLDPAVGKIHVRFSMPGESSVAGPPKWRKIRNTAYPKILQDVLEPLRGSPESLVFSRAGEPIGYKRWASAFRRAAKKAGVPTASLHGLRHSLATHLRESGVSDEHIRAAFGWADAGIQERYTHRDLYDLTKQSEAVNSLMGGSIEYEPPDEISTGPFHDPKTS